MAVDQRDAVDRVLATTRSVRRRIDWERPIPRELIERCVELAAQAPTGIGGELWRFLVVTDREPKQELAALYRSAFDEIVEQRLAEQRERGGEATPPAARYRFLADHLADFPALILVCGIGRAERERVGRQVAFYGSLLPAAWSLMLALRARGVGATWTTLLANRQREVARLLAIPEDVTQTVLLPVGYTRDAVLRPAERRGAAEVTFWNAWGRSKV